MGAPPSEQNKRNSSHLVLISGILNNAAPALFCVPFQYTAALFFNGRNGGGTVIVCVRAYFENHWCVCHLRLETP